MNKIKIISAAVCCAIVLSTFASCSKDSSNSGSGSGKLQSGSQSNSQSALPEDTREPGYYPDETDKKQELASVGTYNGEEISFDLFRYHYVNIVAAMQQSGEFDEEKAKEITLEYIKSSAAIRSVAATNGLEISKEDEATVEEMVKNQKALFASEEEFEAQMKLANITLDVYKANLTEGILFNKVVEKLYKDDIIANVEENYVQVKHILVNFPQDADDKQKEEIKTKADEIIAKLDGGAVFEDLIEEYNEDPGQTEDGYLFTKGEMVKEFEDKSFEMSVGDISEPVLSQFGYHIIKKYEIDKAAIEKNLTAYASQDTITAFSKLVEDAGAALEFVKGDEWDNLNSKTVV